MSLSRRSLLKTCATVPLVLGASRNVSANPSIELRPRAVVINGKPVFLAAGSIDYFRCPHQLWRDRLVKAKRAGLNTISSCVAWNFHERREREFDFTGDCDIGSFLDICDELGLYAFMRVGPFICDEWDAGGEPAAPPVSLSGPVYVRAARSPRGYLLFVNPRFPVNDSAVYRMDGHGPLITLEEHWPMAELASNPGTLELPSGERIELAEPSSYSSMLPFQLELGPGCRIDYANATLLGATGAGENRILLFRGTLGRRGIVSVNGDRLDFVFRSGAPAQFRTGSVTVFALPGDIADRTWFADGRVLIGPAFVGERQGDRHECHIDCSETSIQIISERGELAEHKVTRAGPGAPTPVLLNNWKSRPLIEIESSGNGWRELAEPKTVEELGAYWGYSWYRASYHSAEAQKTGLLFTQAADRIHVFVNGKKMGVAGRGAGAARDPLDVELVAGENEFVFLCDNMGRLSEGKCLDRKGIGGPAYIGAAARQLGEPRWSVPDRAPTNSWEYQTYAAFVKGSLSRATWDITSQNDQGFVLSLRWLPQFAWIAVNGKTVGEHAGDLSLAGGIDFSSFVLDEHSGAPMTLKITFFGERTRDIEDHVRLLSYPKAQQLRRWGFREWQNPNSEGPPVPSYPVWWECEFTKPSSPGPHFVVPQGLSKGQVYLNGRELGRYWDIGPQHSLYMPEPWLTEQNILAVFDEGGKHPGNVYVIQDQRAPVSTLFV